MPTTHARQQLSGIGPVQIEQSLVYAYWQYTYDRQEDGARRAARWNIRVTLDDFDRLDLPPFGWVRLRLPGQEPETVCLRSNRDFPPFTVLNFDRCEDA